MFGPDERKNVTERENISVHMSPNFSSLIILNSTFVFRTFGCYSQFFLQLCNLASNGTLQLDC